MGRVKKDKEEIISKLMRNLDCTREEAEEVFAYDDLVDHSQSTVYDLTPEQQKIAQKYTSTGTRQTKPKSAPTVYKFETKKRKENATKSGIIAELSEFLTSGSQFETSDIEITNKEREITLRICGEWYKVTLSYCRNMNKAEGK